MIRAASELETSRLRLRMWRESDFPTYETWCANIDIMRYLGGKTMNRLEAWRHLAHLVGHWTFRGYGYYAVEERSTGRLVGRVGYTNGAGWPGFELGWTIVPEFQGRGYATEAATFLLAYAFEVLDQPHVISLVHADNIPSQRVAAKLGETIEGETEVLGMPVRIHGISREAWRTTAVRQ